MVVAVIKAAVITLLLSSKNGWITHSLSSANYKCEEIRSSMTMINM